MNHISYNDIIDNEFVLYLDKFQYKNISKLGLINNLGLYLSVCVGFAFPVSS